MNIFKPNYFDKFKCIADRCTHSCCVGWEIDIDEKTYEEYKKCEGEMGERLKENISEEDCPHFVLGYDERCPFLNENNLCDIIIFMGEDKLCNICSEHPRFVNSFSNRDEVGIGMCCEEAVRIILESEEKTEILGKDEPTDEEEVFFNFRRQVFSVLQDRDWDMDERCENLCYLYGIEIEEKDWKKVFLSLERLDEQWEEYLEALDKTPRKLTKDWDVAFEQIIVYFVYRHLSEGCYDGRLKERLAFAVLSYKVIKAIFSQGEENMENLIEICRMYSSEIEYSVENTEALMDELEQK